MRHGKIYGFITGLALFVVAAIGFAGTANYRHLMIVQSGDAPTCTYATADGEICVEGDAEIQGDGYVSDDMTVTDDLAVGGDLEIGGAVSSVEQVIGIPLTQARVFDALNTLIPNTAANDDAALVGAIGSDGMSIQTADEGGSSAEQHHYFAFSWVVPSSYVAGSTVKLVLTGGMLRVADQASTTVVDVTAFVNDYANADLTISGDLCATAAITAINSTTFADHSFTIDDDATGYVLEPGQEVWFTVRMTVDDDNDAGNDITMVIEKINIVISA